MRLRIASLTIMAAAVIAALTLTSAALAHHLLQYEDDQEYSSGNWIGWRTGFDWLHNDDLHFKGYAANGGDPFYL